MSPSRIGLLAFVCSLVLFSSSANAFAPIQITKSSAADRHPTWSADGSFIVFESNRSGNAWHLYIVPAMGGEETQLSFDPESQMNPEISPDGTKIVYVQGSADVSGGIYYSGISVMPISGGPATVLVSNDGRKRLDPTWSPDGSTIYFTRSVSSIGDWDIYKVPATGGQESFVLDFGNDFGCAVSPNGNTLTWAKHPPDKPYNLFQVPLSSPANPSQLTFETANTAQPGYSPDGLRIAFASRKVLGRMELFEIELASKTITRLTFDAENSPSDPLNQFPRYSPDGERLAFSSARQTGEQNIWVLPFTETPPPPPTNFISITSGQGIPGPGSVSLAISLTSGVSTPALEFEVVDAPDWLHIVGVTPRGRASGFTASFADDERPHVVMYGASGQVIPGGVGPILDLEVIVRPQAIENDSTVISFDHIIMADKEGHALPVDWKGGTFHVHRLSGDVNGDNEVDTGDLIRLVEFILKTGAPPTDPELKEADCNDDDAYNVLDIVCLLDVILGSPGPALATGGSDNQTTWAFRAEEPVRGLQFFTGGGDWSQAGDFAPFQLHQPAILGAGLRIAFDDQGASWESGSVHMLRAPSSITGIKAFGAGGRLIPTHIEGNEIVIGTVLPGGLHVLPASPNPFTLGTDLAFSLDQPSSVTISVYDVRGVKVSSSDSSRLPAGRHVWHWSALDERGHPLPSGVYIAVVDSERRRSALRLNHLR